MLPGWVLWVIVCAAIGGLVLLRPGWWLAALACLALLAGAPALAVGAIAAGLWLLLLAVRMWRRGSVAA